MWRGARESVLDFPAVIKTSLAPATPSEAEIVGRQLDLARTSMLLFDYVVPVAGVALVFAHTKLTVEPPLVVWWLAVAALCVINEIIFARWWPAGNDPQRVKRKAWTIFAMTCVLTSVWSTGPYWLWIGNEQLRGFDMFAMLVLAGTLAGVSTMLAVHAAAVTVPIAIISVQLLLWPLADQTVTRIGLMGLAAAYAALMAGQASVVHARVLRMLRSEQDRESLIESLRVAKAESDIAREEAVKASRAKSEFLANMSHELRTPLNAILGFSDIIRSRAFGDATQRYSEYGSFIHDSGEKLLALISDILELANIESGRKVPQEDLIDLAEISELSVERLVKDAAAKGVRITTRIQVDLPYLRADRLALEQILAQLLSNAVKFTPQGGDVIVSATKTVTDAIDLSVCDTGVGIAPDLQEGIFSRLGGASQKRSSNRGPGLGLALVKGLVDVHGGEITLESQLGEGTTVTVSFPATATVVKSALSAHG